MDLLSFPDDFRVCVIGASGAIGNAFVEAFQQNPRCAKIVALHRNSVPAIELCDERSIELAAEQIQSLGPFHLIIHAAGMLHQSDRMPEKKLGDINMEQLHKTFMVNTFGPAIVIRHFSKMLDRERGVFALMSAKVGSIEDNRLGGWYSYRASKAALNMLIKTAAIEIQRKQGNAVMVAMHPGTVCSALSQPFRGAEIGRPARQAVTEMLGVIDRLKNQDSGCFFSYDGQQLPW
ncbi:SDR family NAD(P)-dependent oxidoreductase [Undibacterium fentianense]|uniref:SDR family NAD(P)-dependent oxidoreductase n=1 Tax=Undibacterium fentianense TaxID=2828728 RepID=A0A941IFC0_9BURK|nr:SDR family NAD(P)-dependent oxidoreductase [Undibacterium fentianense]MBR7800222.1 SDR family NAD(P)-dependent oxidoreductase [Undibacterium fentianense]